LRKRDNFRAAFAGFDFDRVAQFTDEDVERLVQDAGIIRHRGKIVSTINNARRAQELVKEAGSLAAFFWSFEPGAADRPARVDRDALIANPTTPVSTRISKDLKKRGWTFVGPTTVYAFMQAMGMVNDHIEGCYCRAEIEAERARFKRPK
jgi:DNA-3-methyladenine glycosylase I